MKKPESWFSSNSLSKLGHHNQTSKSNTVLLSAEAQKYELPDGGKRYTEMINCAGDS